eukprot:gene13967-16059_t
MPPKAELMDEKKLFFSQKTFESMGLSSTLIQCVDTLGFMKPSKIQALSYYGINTGKPCIIADQTGSGKTLAYLLPTLQRMFLFVTATLPDVVVSQIVSEFPEVMTLKGPGLHRIASSVEEILVDCSGAPDQQRSMEQVMNNKKNVLLEALNKSTSERTIVFCNSIDQCRRVENILQRDDRSCKSRTVLSYHGAIEGSTRDENLKDFSKQLLQRPVVLISTDRASRGLDFNQAQVDHVILYDFPKEPSEYLRRVGRTGRAGRAGRATVLVFGKQVPAARAVRKAGMEGKRIQPSDNL